MIGAIIVLAPLDFETTNQYELTVRATDIHTASYSDAIVRISIEVGGA